MNTEEIARSIFRAASLSPDQPVDGGPAEIAARLDIDVYDQPRAMAEATLATMGGQRRIVLRRGLELRRANFLIAQMIARHVVGLEIAVPKPDLERAVGAWLVAPPDPFRARYHQVGCDIAALAAPFVITPTAAVLRLNEVIGTELVVWRRSLPPIRRCRGLLGQLPNADIDTLVSRRAPRSIHKVRLRDDGAAVALLAS